MMVRQIIGGLMGLWLGSTGMAMAQGASGVVVELYTSQGCSSCPPADAYLKKLAAEPGIIALALHVDYWDYIGWADDFASPDYTARQKTYAHAMSSNSIFTPQMIVAGVDSAEGNDPSQVEGSVRRHMAAADMVTLQLMRQGQTLTIHATANVAVGQPLRVQLVRYTPSVTREIKHGENAGRVIEYTNIVTSWQQLGTWSGDGDLQMTAPVPGNDRVVVILQAAGPGMIFAASELQ